MSGSCSTSWHAPASSPSTPSCACRRLRAGGNIGAAQSVSLDMEGSGDSDRERFALAALESVELVAPPRLRARIDAERERARRPARRRRLALSGAFAGAAAALVLALLLVLPGGAGGPTVVEAAELGQLPATGPPPARRGHSRLGEGVRMAGHRPAGRRTRWPPGRHGLLRKGGARARVLNHQRERDPVAGGLESRRGGRQPLRPSGRGRSAGRDLAAQGRAQLRPVGLRRGAREGAGAGQLEARRLDD